ncbi:DeoR/GlpR family DNA-binding transcription regulator [Maridesulfovibrio hydrothermalis]|uniref:DNA-binding transcriptional repressor n=1 Tax=Maridesulfovibrio hydrothermalis AM13 = DSM 14728 TaxID=1121451 RepID=L0R846_9BACT|nr:DeoR family transcriptional regulator [Maridesulfovibrio hydrothermalis]CCO22375.1 DNA-binding transcriptional repressor [Maridesulfovibrio hydrothermalis AM13 = DSM 14728]
MTDTLKSTKRKKQKPNLTSLSKRQREILDVVSEEGFAPIESLAQQFEVTPQTIRRDINKLCEHQLLQRFHGGAGRFSSVENVDYNDRKNILYKEKRLIAEMVGKHIPDRASLFINLGTTTEEVAKTLTGHKGLRVITNNLNVALIMSNNDCEVIVAGGMVRQRDKGITGEATVEFIKQFKVDFGIIGVSGIDADGTLLDYDYHEVRVAREIINNARNVFLVTDHTKFKSNAMVRIADLSEIDAIFTDKKPPLVFRELMQSKEVDLFVTEPE